MQMAGTILLPSFALKWEWLRGCGDQLSLADCHASSNTAHAQSHRRRAATRWPPPVCFHPIDARNTVWRATCRGIAPLARKRSLSLTFSTWG
jgi:hypothetical protein